MTRVCRLAVRATVVVTLAASLGVAPAGASAPTTALASVVLKDAQGRTRGTAFLLDDGHTTTVEVLGAGVAPGVHALQLHPTSSCRSPFGTVAPIRSVVLPGVSAGPTKTVLSIETIGSIGLAHLTASKGLSLVLHALPDNLANVPDRYRSATGAGPDAATTATGDAGAGILCGTVKVHSFDSSLGGLTGLVPLAAPERSTAVGISHSLSRLRSRAAGPKGTDLGRADLVDQGGHPVGIVGLIANNGGGVVVSLDVHGLPPGVHGLQIHTVGACTPPDFASAGDHVVASSLPNLIVGRDGTATVFAEAVGPTVESLLSGDGAAVVVQRDADNAANIPDRYTADGATTAGPDAQTKLSGDAGPGIACGRLRMVPDAERYVDAVSNDLLGRTPTPTESTSWQLAVKRHGRAAFVRSIATSTEALGQLVDQYYSRILRTTPTAARRASWVAYLHRPKSTLEHLSSQLLGSDALYRAVGSTPTNFIVVATTQQVQREPTPPELAIRLRELALGRSRATVAAEIAASPEARALQIDDAYYFALGADATLAQDAYWLGRFAAGDDVRAVNQQLFASPAYYDQAVAPATVDLSVLTGLIQP